MERETSDTGRHGAEEKRFGLEAIRAMIGEYMRQREDQQDSDVQGMLAEERRKRENLERQLSELGEENRRTRRQSEQTDRVSRIQSCLQELGVRKVPLALRLVKDEIVRGDDGELYAEVKGSRVPYRDYLEDFVAENPEFLPPRIAGGSGASGGAGGEMRSGGIDLNSIRPGMSREELAEAWKEVARLASDGGGGWG
jgi:hypothetical protein